MATKTKTNTLSDPRIRFNWGVDDGRQARKAGRLPLWAQGKAHVYQPRHPFDSKYGEGFWAGWNE